VEGTIKCIHMEISPLERELTFQECSHAVQEVGSRITFVCSRELSILTLT